MKNLTFYLLSVFILLLAACGNNEEPSTEEATATKGEDNSEITELEEENEELRRQLEEQDEEDGDGEATEETEAGSDDNGTGSSDTAEGTESEDNQDDHTEGNRSDLVFDINSAEVRSQLIGTRGGNPENNFEQNAITLGMSQTEVEEMYGPYDVALESPYGVAPAVYGNLSILYSEGAPFGEGDDLSSPNINPDTNIVMEVHFFANVNEEELINALGEPDEIYNIVDGSKTYHYQGTGEDGRYFNTNADTSLMADGEVIGIIKRNIEDEDPNAENKQSNASAEGLYFEKFAHTEGFPVTITNEKDNVDDYYIYDTLTNFTNDYIYSLVAYFNDESDSVIDYVNGSALNKIESNKNSGNF